MPTPKYLGLVGCYTKPGQADPFEELGGVPHDRTKIGNGLLAIAVDEEGRLSFLNGGAPIVTAEEVPNPSYLCILEKCGGSGRPEALRGGGACVVSELNEGKLHTFALSCEHASGETKIGAEAVGSAVDTGGSYPCHVISCTVGSEECIVVCNYGEEEGVLSLFGTNEGANGYARKVRVPFGAGSKVDMDRQEGSHAHSTSTITPLTASSKMDLCCADLGSDTIVQFALNADTGSDGEVSLQCIEKERLAAPPGSGPRSLTFNPVHSNVAIVSLEMTAQVWLMHRLDDGSFEGLGDPVSVLPPGWPDPSANEAKFNQGRWASDAVWSPDGRYVYAAARLHNSISVFELETSESAAIEGLKLVQRVSREGITPRCLCMSECGRFILVAHQHSHDISSFRRNGSDGTLAFVNRLEVPNAACVKLVRPE
ncbi:hypothetical protein ACHAXT_000359 [Thalassiosira profunda]